MRYLPYVSGGSATLNPATEVLTVSEVGKIYTQQLSGNYTGDSFDLAPDGNGGTDITLGAIATDIFVTNFGTDTVGEYTTAGATVNASLISGFSFPEGIAVSGSDLFVANANATSEGSLGPGWIGEYTTSGATVDAKLISGLDSPSYIAIANAADPTEHPSNDFNGDGFSDLLWQNSSGAAAIWEMDGTSTIAATIIGNPDPSWHAVASGDFNHDGFADNLWQNDDGSVAIWEMNGATPTLEALAGGNPGASWHAKGTGNFFGNGDSDILWQNDDGSVAIWEMNGTTVIDGGSVANSGPSWHVMGAGDYNKDDRSDILFQNSSGAVAVWEVSGTTITHASTLANPGPTWHV